MHYDDIAVTILARGFAAIAEEMGTNLVRSAFSTVVREARDCSAALLDADGYVIAQAEMQPMHTAALSQSFRASAEQLELSKIDENSAIIMNDPYSGGQHLNDIILFQPIFFEGELLGWAANTVHHLDIGGGSAGVNTAATDLIGEGLVIPPLLIDVPRDWYGGTVERLIFANIRTAEIGLGDLNAQFAANHIGRERIKEIASRYGTAMTKKAMSACLDYSDRLMRSAIRQMPDGQWTGEAFMDRDVFDKNPVRIFVTVTIADDEMTLDFEGSDKQVKGMFNVPISSATAAAFSAVRNVLGDMNIPSNDGCNRAVKLKFPQGSILNPNKGAPVRARMVAALRVLDAVHVAMANALPDRVPAQGYNTTTGFYIAQPQKDGTVKVFLDVMGGGYGAAKDYDGASAVDTPLGSCRNTPVEAIEQANPHLRVVGYRLAEDSCGAGKFQGGLGFSRSIMAVEDGVFFNMYSDHFVLPPKGLFGGTDSALGALQVERDGKITKLESVASRQLAKGETVTMRVGGGAGWGNPAERPVELVRRDLAEGLISEEFAKRNYPAQYAQI